MEISTSSSAKRSKLFLGKTRTSWKQPNNIEKHTYGSYLTNYIFQQAKMNGHKYQQKQFVQMINPSSV
jgi:hypothetical protein